MKHLGQYLKNKRIEQGLSLEQAALVTKISKTRLMAIEEANAAKLPPKSYLRGFVTSYGRYLSCDMDHLLELFSQEMGSTNPKTEIDVVKKETWKTIPLINRVQINSKTLIACGLLVLTGLAFFTRSVVKKYQNEAITVPPAVVSPDLTTPLPENAQAAGDDVIQEKSTDETKAKENIKPELADQPEDAPANTATATAEVNKTTEQEKAQAVIAQDTFTSQSEDWKEVIIQAKSPTSIQVKIGDDDAKNIKMTEGEFHTIKAKSKIQFETDNASSVEVIYNGILQTKTRVGKNRLELTY